MTQQKKVTIISEEDSVWALFAWEKTIPKLQSKGYEISGFWLVPARLTKHTGFQIPLWYLKTFGLLDFVRLVLFALLAQSRRWLQSITANRVGNFEQLCQQHNITLQRAINSNAPEVIDDIQRKNVDIVVIMVSDVLKKQIIAAPNRGCINKHAAFLPANRGLYPYLWATLDETPQGVSYHQVAPEIDAGDLLYQKKIDQPSHLESMITFYHYVFTSYPEHILQAIKALVENRAINKDPTIQDSYYSLPKKDDVVQFRKKGGKIIRWRDLMLGWKI
ncbi:formyltransferase family protein [Magnetococcales bacterium HHB-1]